MSLTLDSEGIAWRGMVIRHLVLPEGLSGTPKVLQWIARNLSSRVHVSLMDQYFPAYECVQDPVLGRKITPDEYEAAFEALDAAGLEEGWIQEHDDCPVESLEEGPGEWSEERSSIRPEEGGECCEREAIARTGPG